MLLVKNHSEQYSVEPLQPIKNHVRPQRPNSKTLDSLLPRSPSLSVKHDQPLLETTSTQAASVTKGIKVRRAEAESSASEALINSVPGFTPATSSGPLSRATVAAIITGVTFCVLISLFVIFLSCFRHRKDQRRRGLPRSIVQQIRRHRLASSESLTSFDTSTDDGRNGRGLDRQDELLLPKMEQDADGFGYRSTWKLPPASIVSTTLSLTPLSPSPTYSSQSRQPLISHTRSSSETSRSYSYSLQSKLEIPSSSLSRGHSRSQSASRVPAPLTPPQRSFSHSRSASDDSPLYQRHVLSTIIDRTSNPPSPVVSASLRPIYDSPHSLASLSHDTLWLTPPLPSYKRMKLQDTVAELPALSPTSRLPKKPIDLSKHSAGLPSSVRLYLDSKPLPPVPPSLSSLSSSPPLLSVPITNIRPKHFDKPRQLRGTRSDTIIGGGFAKSMTSERHPMPFQELLSPTTHIHQRITSIPRRKPIPSMNSYSNSTSKPSIQAPYLTSPRPVLAVDTNDDIRSTHLCPCSCTHPRSASTPLLCSHRSPISFQSPYAHTLSPASSTHGTVLSTLSAKFPSNGPRPTSPTVIVPAASQPLLKPDKFVRTPHQKHTELQVTNRPNTSVNDSYFDAEITQSVNDHDDTSSMAFSPLLHNSPTGNDTERNTKIEFEAAKPMRSPSISVPIMFSFPIQRSIKHRQMARAARVALQNGSINLS